MVGEFSGDLPEFYFSFSSENEELFYFSSTPFTQNHLKTS